MFSGPVDVLFAEGDYLEPDIVFVGSDRLELLSDRGIEGAPDLVVEVISPSTADRDRGIKLERYRLYGVGEYRVVDRDARTVDVWRISDGAEQPITLGPEDRLRWSPGDGSAVLELPIGELMGGG